MNFLVLLKNWLNKICVKPSFLKFKIVCRVVLLFDNQLFVLKIQRDLAFA